MFLFCTNINMYENIHVLLKTLQPVEACHMMYKIMMIAICMKNMSHHGYWNDGGKRSKMCIPKNL